MKYNFPRITHIDQIAKAVEDTPEINLMDKGEFTVVDYVYNSGDTFPEPTTDDPELNYNYALLRECRGIKFSNYTGRPIARPYHKFFNTDEKPETQLQNINWDQDFIILEKLDGSMVHPVLFGDDLDNVVMCTKNGSTDVSVQAEKFIINNNTQHLKMSFDLLNEDYTPIFEWCSRKNRIVVGYPVDRLVLTGVRHNVTGEYLSYDQLLDLGEKYNIEVVKSYPGTFNGINEFINDVRDMQDEEGYVIRFSDGHMVKIKNLWYVQLHKTLEMVGSEKEIWKFVFDGNLDDAKALLPEDLTQSLDNFERDLWDQVQKVAENIDWNVKEALDNYNGSRKDFAQNVVSNFNPALKPVLFKVWDGYHALDVLVNHIYNQLNNNKKLQNAQEILGIKWDDY